jgi:hypothetical protein
MDGSRFDYLTRKLGSTRRQALTATALGLLGVAVPAVAPEAAADPRPPAAHGPCGDRGPKANRCQRHNQCCTGYCNKKIGRCRCRKRGQTCKSQASCCNPDLSCQRQGSSRRCLPSTPPPPPPVDCVAALEGAGCEFVPGTDVWNCGGDDLSGLNLSGCNLSGASFSTTNASAVNFTNAVLTGANFFDANVTGAVWVNTTCPEGTNSNSNGNTCCGEFILGQSPTGC